MTDELAIPVRETTTTPRAARLLSAASELVASQPDDRDVVLSVKVSAE